MKPIKIINVKQNGEREEAWECSECRSIYKYKEVCKECCGEIKLNDTKNKF